MKTTKIFDDFLNTQFTNKINPFLGELPKYIMQASENK